MLKSMKKEGEQPRNRDDNKIIESGWYNRWQNIPPQLQEYDNYEKKNYQ